MGVTVRVGASVAGSFRIGMAVADAEGTGVLVAEGVSVGVGGLVVFETGTAGWAQAASSKGIRRIGQLRKDARACIFASLARFRLFLSGNQ